MNSIIPHSRSALYCALFLTLGLAAFKGGALEWAYLFWSTLVSIAVIATLGLAGLRDNVRYLHNIKLHYRASSKSHSHIAFASLAVFQLWALFQALWLSPDSTASLDSALLGISMLLLLVIWALSGLTEKSLMLLYSATIFVALFQSAYGLWVYLTQTNMLLWMEKIHYLDRPTGWFVNANHFAAFLVVCIIFCVSRLLTQPPQKTQQSWMLGLINALYNPNTVILSFLSVTLLATKSAGAILSLMVALSILLLHRSPSKKGLSVALAAIIILVGVVALNLDYTEIESEAFGLAHTIERRIDLSLAAFGMLKEHWVLGIGGGAFYSQFSPYRNLDIGNAYYNYAHNDWLQFWIEYGIIGISCLLLFMTSVIKDNLRVISESDVGIRATFAYTSVFATIALACHSLVDFPLHLPGFSVLYLVIISINSLYFLTNNK